MSVSAFLFALYSAQADEQHISKPVSHYHSDQPLAVVMCKELQQYTNKVTEEEGCEGQTCM